MTGPSHLVKCGKPDCMRKVPASSAFCCGPCATAAGGRYEIEAHTPSCDGRAAQRGEFRSGQDW